MNSTLRMLHEGSWEASCGFCYMILNELNNPSSNPSLEGGALEQGAGDCGGIFFEIGYFTSLIASSSANDALAFGFGGSAISNAMLLKWQHQKLPESMSSGGGGTLLPR